ncbi:MAG: hypothetical protein GX353_09915 [Oligella ureolytica]|nr:hypothetical protein [Oligella ureolytica]
MKKEMIFRATIIILLAALIITLIIAVTLSWFWGTMEFSHQFVVQADGVLYIYVPASVENTGQTLTPAVAMPHAVSNNLPMDVLREYDENDPQPSYVMQAAKVSSHTTEFVFYSQYTRYVQAVDESGNPIFDESGNPVYVQKVDESGNPVFDESGNPVYEEEPVPADITYQLALKDSPNEDYGKYLDMEEITIKEIYFSYSPQPIPDGLPRNEENGAIPFTNISQDKTFGSIRVEGTTRIYIHLSIYITNVEELMDPVFKNSDIYIELELAVQLEPFM